MISFFTNITYMPNRLKLWPAIWAIFKSILDFDLTPAFFTSYHQYFVT